MSSNIRKWTTRTADWVATLLVLWFVMVAMELIHHELVGKLNEAQESGAPK